MVRNRLLSSVKQLGILLDDVSYTCGAMFEDLDLPPSLSSVCIKAHNCFDPIEKLYYSCGLFEPICYYCGRAVEMNADEVECYPRCDACTNKVPVKKNKRSKKH